MPVVALIDVNGQTTESATTLASAASSLGLTRVVLAGARGRVNFWRQMLVEGGMSAAAITEYPSRDRRSDTVIELTSVAWTEVFSMTPGVKDTVLLVSVKEGFKTLAEKLTAFTGAILPMKEFDVHWVPVVTPNHMTHVMGGTEDYATIVRNTAIALHAGKPSKGLLIAELANHLIALFPELKDPNRRTELFGSKRFKKMCIASGLKVAGAYAYPPGKND